MKRDLEIEICHGPAQDTYSARVISAISGGEPIGNVKLDLDNLLGTRKELEKTILASTVAARRMVRFDEKEVRQFGEILFKGLFNGAVYGTYRASLGAVQQRGEELRLVLRVTTPRLAAVPWEMLFDPETGAFICLDHSLVRHVPSPYTVAPLEVRPPLRILAVVSSPRGLGALDVDAERRNFEEALAPLVAGELVILEWEQEATWAKVHGRLLTGEWHVLHFIGHSDYDEMQDEGFLAFVGADGRADLVAASRLVWLFRQAHPALRLVVLNSCSSGAAGVRDDLFSGIAAALVHRGISAVVAMQFTVSDIAAIAFANGFYSAISNGRGIDEAVGSGRVAVLGIHGSLEWVTPVLYLRGDQTHLFTFTKPVQQISQSSSPIPGRPPGRSPELDKLFVEVQATLRLEDYDKAIELLNNILKLDPQQARATALLFTAQRGKQLAEIYQRARAAEDACEWISATHAYGKILQVDPAYQDAASRKGACEMRQKVADLNAELNLHADAKQWQAVIKVYMELIQLTPPPTDLDKLAARARQELGIDPLCRILSEGWGVNQVCWNADGSRVAVATGSAWVSVQVVEDLKEVLRVKGGSWIAVVYGVVFSLDGARLATGSSNSTARIWDVVSGNKLLEVIHDLSVHSVTFSSDSAWLATGSEDKTARIWDAVSGNKLLEVSHDQPVHSVAFSPDDARLATGSVDKTARIWDAATGKQLLEMRHDGTVRSVAFSPDGARLATGSEDKTARIWDAATGKQLLEMRHDGTVRSVAFSPDGARLATGSSDGGYIWLVPKP